MGDFLADDNPCGRSLVHLVSRGNAVIAELLRLKDYIPSTFRFVSHVEIYQLRDSILNYIFLLVWTINKISRNMVT